MRSFYKLILYSHYEKNFLFIASLVFYCSIGQDTITFQPVKHSFEQVKINLYDLEYIGLSSTGRVVGASVANIFITGAIAVAIIPVLIFDIFFPGSAKEMSYWTNGITWNPFVPFRKNFKLLPYPSEKTWCIRSVSVPANQKDK